MRWRLDYSVGGGLGVCGRVAGGWWEGFARGLREGLFHGNRVARGLLLGVISGKVLFR